MIISVFIISHCPFLNALLRHLKGDMNQTVSTSLGGHYAQFNGIQRMSGISMKETHIEKKKVQGETYREQVENYQQRDIEFISLEGTPKSIPAYIKISLINPLKGGKPHIAIEPNINNKLEYGIFFTKPPKVSMFLV